VLPVRCAAAAVWAAPGVERGAEADVVQFCDEAWVCDVCLFAAAAVAAAACCVEREADGGWRKAAKVERKKGRWEGIVGFAV